MSDTLVVHNTETFLDWYLSDESKRYPKFTEWSGSTDDYYMIVTFTGKDTYDWQFGETGPQGALLFKGKEITLLSAQLAVEAAYLAHTKEEFVKVETPASEE